MIAAAVLAALATACVLAAEALIRARWTWHAPRTAILLWQSVGVTWGLATTGALLAYALEPYGRGVVHGLAGVLTTFSYGVHDLRDLVRLTALVAGLALLALLVALPLTAGAQTLRARRRHRELLSLIARDEPAVPGVRVVDFPGAAAYCLPGLRSEVVISNGTLSLLSPDELHAVLAHESAHVRERHDLVLLPFAALRRALPWSRLIRDAQASVELLIEMAADDRARRQCSPRRLATALLRFGTATATLPTPDGALGTLGGTPAGPARMPGRPKSTAGANVMARVNRLVRPEATIPAPHRFLILTGSVVLTASALLLWLIPG
ncbi:M56 family metallopeptidase [Sphaerimonospora thailandensis]|uniref:Integral membrane protein n=1 Tax=Sphaerimonospora thailandensis TaxID=795644 RepID=A0A8J3RJE0_9ACTN|nr:M56 family metallopeptidase [Sphaerimonospora thailandensis]GIH73408.1 integral membrane protein [Sphaerimonospora thailandensis]